MNANTTIQQLGGRRFIAMTGAKNFYHYKNSLSFRIGSGATRGVNLVKITLNGLDLYDLEFYRSRGTKLKIVSSVENVYFDQLQTVFTENTGFYTHL